MFSEGKKKGIDGGRGFQIGRNVFQIGTNTFYDQKKNDENSRVQKVCPKLEASKDYLN
jgi:hypothetical protein